VEESKGNVGRVNFLAVESPPMPALTVRYWDRLHNRLSLVGGGWTDLWEPLVPDHGVWWNVNDAKEMFKFIPDPLTPNYDVLVVDRDDNVHLHLNGRPLTQWTEFSGQIAAKQLAAAEGWPIKEKPMKYTYMWTDEVKGNHAFHFGKIYQKDETKLLSAVRPEDWKPTIDEVIKMIAAHGPNLDFPDRYTMRIIDEKGKIIRKVGFTAEGDLWDYTTDVEAPAKKEAVVEVKPKTRWPHVFHPERRFVGTFVDCDVWVHEENGEKLVTAAYGRRDADTTIADLKDAKHCLAKKKLSQMVPWEQAMLAAIDKEGL
jgi:hypothetical protein